jgi:CheY-like chemotaxis protein
VAAVLWAHRSTFLSHEPDAIQISSFEAEMARLQPHPRPVDVRELLERVLAAVELQALQRDVQLHIGMPAEPVIISVDPVMAEQVLMNTLSYAVEQAYPGSFHVVLRVGDEGVLLTLRYFLESGAAGALVVNLVMAQLADRLGWAVAQEDEPEGPRFVTLHIRARGPIILVIDDNEELVDLLELYLTAEACRITAASDGVEGLRLAQELIPDAIILDVMMPGMSGWEVLQRVRRHPKTTEIPVIMCSVINNPRLAYCLGASLFLPKPVSRTQIVRALRQVGVL